MEAKKNKKKKKQKRRAQQVGSAADDGEDSDGDKSVDNGVLYNDRKGRCFCSAHRRVLCNVCCVDYRMPNEFILAHRRGENADVDAVTVLQERLSLAELEALSQNSLASPGDPEVYQRLQQIHQGMAPPPPTGRTGKERCVGCGAGGASQKLKRCGGCTLRHAVYCSSQCQRAHWPEHRAECKADNSNPTETDSGAGGAGGGSSSAVSTRTGPPPKLVSWRELERLGGLGLEAEGQVLEVRIMSQPMPHFMRSCVNAQDKRGDQHTIAFYTQSPPSGLAQGRVLRWRNPRFHYFLSGQTGSRVEDEDLPNITIADS